MKPTFKSFVIKFLRILVICGAAWAIVALFKMFIGG